MDQYFKQHEKTDRGNCDIGAVGLSPFSPSFLLLFQQQKRFLCQYGEGEGVGETSATHRKRSIILRKRNSAIATPTSCDLVKTKQKYTVIHEEKYLWLISLEKLRNEVLDKTLEAGGGGIFSTLPLCSKNHGENQLHWAVNNDCDTVYSEAKCRLRPLHRCPAAPSCRWRW